MDGHRVGGGTTGLPQAAHGDPGSSRRPLAVVVTVLMVAVGCSSDGRKAATARTAPAANERSGSEPAVGAATFASAPCPPDVVATAPVTLTCGSVTVPERHSRPDGPKVVLPVAVLQPPGGAAHPDPIVYLDGGPGGDGVSNAGQLSELPIARGSPTAPASALEVLRVLPA
jgi:hypothetical protein